LFSTKNLKSAKEYFSPEEQFSDTVNIGLSLEKKSLPSWLLFDKEGSEIFKKITELPGYLPAASEFEIIRNHKKDIAKLITGNSFNLIELGSGDGCKTQILIKHLLNENLDFHYFPIDISSGAVTNLVRSLEDSYYKTSLKVTGLIGDYFDGLDVVKPDGKSLVLLLGVSLNNMDLSIAKVFLKRLNQTIGPKGYLLVGFDLMKDPKLLYSAYNDPLFEKFNLYLLDRINQELDADFNKEYFSQQGQFNPHTGAVESYLYSTRDQTIHVKKLNKKFNFNAWETIQTEQSFKYTLAEIENLAEENGFEIVENLFDSRKYFVDSVWKVKH
jgi:L-histidine N-alpha-methyltransferase